MTVQNKDAIRVFIAIDPTPEIYKNIDTLMEHLKKQSHASKVKWTKLDKLHLTLRFMGNLTHDLIDQLKMQLETITHLHESFTLRFEKIIIFPEHHPRIIGLAAKLDHALASLVDRIEKSVQELGLEAEDRVFLPHITLGRLTSHAAFDLTQTLAFFPIEFEVDAIVLYQSELHATGSIYRPLIKYHLEKK